MHHTGLNSFTVTLTDTFFILRQAKHLYKNGGLILLLPIEATTEEKTNSCLWTDAVLCTIEEHKLFQQFRIYASRRIIVNTDNEERDRKGSNRKGLIDH